MEAKNVDTNIEEPKMKRKREDPLNAEEIQQFDSSDEDSAIPEHILSSSPGLTLPPELLSEINKYMGFDGLRQCCQTNFQMKALTLSAAMKMRQKLEDLYLVDVRQLAEWFQCWKAKNQEISTKLLQSFAAKTATTAENYGHQMLTITSLLDEFCQRLDQLGDKIIKVILAEKSKKWSRSSFRLSPNWRVRFIWRRRNLAEDTFTSLKAHLQLWRNENKHLWYQESAICREGMRRCNDRIYDCHMLMYRCADLLFVSKY